MLRNLLEPGKELAGSPTVPLPLLQVTVRTQSPRPPTPLVINETQPVYLTPQVQDQLGTRFTDGWVVGWSTHDLFFSFIVGTLKASLSESSDNTNQAFGMTVLTSAFGTGLVIGPALSSAIAGVLWVISPRLYQLNHQGTHTTRARTH